MWSIEFFQSFANPFWDKFFTIATTLAEQYVMMFVIGYFFWCTNRKFAFPFILTIMSGFTINAFLKNLFHIERPFVRFKDEQLRTLKLDTATGYSFPSGHTQSATSVFGIIGFMKKGIFKYFGIILVVLIGVSRMYLGVHTIYDVLAGVAVGAVWAIFGMKLYVILEKKNNPLWYLIYAIPVLLALIFVNPAFPGDTFTLAGTSLGAIIGVVLENMFVRFEPRTRPANQILKMFIGIAGGLLFQAGLKPFFALFATNGSYLSYGLDFLRYFICGMWITFGLPLIAKKFINNNLERKDVKNG